MGWTDVALSIQGPVVNDLKAMFAERWNFIFDEKYKEQNKHNYSAIEMNQAEGDYGGNGMEVQLLRSASRWSNGSKVEKSIQNAYIETIRDSQHFIYIENQFFITATDDNSAPVKNRIGEAIVERIVRAYREGM